MSQITTSNRTKEAKIEFVNVDKGAGCDNDISFIIGDFEVIIIISGESVEIVVDDKN